MTIPVPIVELPQKATALGPFAYVMTSAGNSSPRVTHTKVSFVEGTIIHATLGKSACREVAANQHVTVLWPPKGDDLDGLSLIVDGYVEIVPKEGGGPILIRPLSAILHKRRW